MKAITKHHTRTINRVISAVESGVKMKALADKTGISYFRMSSVVNPDSYKGRTTFTDDELKHINDALNDIKKAVS